jgi:hypothetical protein
VAVAEMVAVRIISRPWGMATVDGTVSERTGKAMTLAVGQHEISIVSSKGGEVKKTITVPPTGLIWCWDFDLGAECAK